MESGDYESLWPQQKLVKMAQTQVNCSGFIKKLIQSGHIIIKNSNEVQLGGNLQEKQVKENSLLSEIESFISKVQLDAEQYILRQIYPTYLHQFVVNKFFDQNILGENQMFTSDPRQISYIPLRKNCLLYDIQKFLYNYCTRGLLYPFEIEIKL